MLRTGGRWRDVPADYGSSTTVYNRFKRWSRRGFWHAMLASNEAAAAHLGDCTFFKADVGVEVLRDLVELLPGSRIIA